MQRIHVIMNYLIFLLYFKVLNLVVFKAIIQTAAKLKCPKVQVHDFPIGSSCHILETIFLLPMLASSSFHA